MRRDILGAGISRASEISRWRTCFSVLKACPFTWNRDNSGGGGGGGRDISLGLPGLPGWPGQLLSMWTLCTGISRRAGTTSPLMRMTSIRTWKPTWRKLQMPHVNTHNIQEEIHLIYIERQQKEKISRKLIKQSSCRTPSCTFKMQSSRVLLWRVRIAPG